MDQKTSVPVVLTEEAKAMLNEGIGLICKQWTAMRTAVDNGWGGRDSPAKAERTVTNIFEHFTLSKDPMDPDEILDILEEGLYELNTEAQDGSVDEVKDILLALYKECCEGNYQRVEELREKSKSQRKASVFKVSDDNDEESDDEDEDEDEDICVNNNQTMDMMVDGSEQSSNQKSEAMLVDEATVDDDGWTVVPSRKNKGKKN